MKLSEAVARVKKTADNEAYNVDIDVVAEALGVQSPFYSKEFMARVKAYWVKRWLCTDTEVGGAVIFFDDEAVGFAFQAARKSSVNIAFFGQAHANKVREFMLSLLDTPAFDTVDLDAEIGDYYVVDYGAQLLDTYGTYNGSRVEVTKKFTGYNEIDNWRRVIVKHCDSGKVENIDVSDLKLDLQLNEEVK